MLTNLITAAPDPSIVGPGRAAFAVVAVLAVATVLLFISMTRHIKRVPPSFPDSSRPTPPAGEKPE